MAKKTVLKKRTVQKSARTGNFTHKAARKAARKAAATRRKSDGRTNEEAALMAIERIVYFQDRRRIDEVVGNGFYHLEQMDDNEYYLAFEGADGELVQLSLVADGPIRVECYSQSERICPPASRWIRTR